MTRYFSLPSICIERGAVRWFALLGFLWTAGVCPAAGQSLPGQVLRPSIIPDIPVVDQDGNAHRFFTDLVKGKVVAINFGYTSCTAVCPVQGRRFQQLQTLLGSRLGQSVFLITVTTDPVHDTPANLKAWGAQFGAKPGWTLVTGVPTDIQQLLGVFVSAAPVTSTPVDPQGGGRQDGYHLPVIVMVNEPRNLMKIDFSLSAPYWINQSLTTWYDPLTPTPVPTPIPAKR